MSWSALFYGFFFAVISFVVNSMLWRKVVNSIGNRQPSGTDRHSGFFGFLLAAKVIFLFGALYLVLAIVQVDPVMFCFGLMAGYVLSITISFYFSRNS